jgi:hypothetical protein
VEGWPGVRCRQVGEDQPILVTRLAAWTGSKLGVRAGMVVDRGCWCGRLVPVASSEVWWVG